MRGSVIRAALQRGHTVVGQVRRDTALFELPPPRAPGRRGRSRLYGAKLDAEAVAQLPVSQHRIDGYGGRMAGLRHCVCRPRFLRGVIVQAVWCELQKGGGGWAKQRLLLSTDLALSAVEVVEAYTKRWTVEPLFAALKLTDGGRDVAAKPDGPVALASPGPDRPRPAGPAHRQGRTRGPRIGPAWWLAQAHDADAGFGQGCTRTAVPQFRGVPPSAHNTR